MLMETYGIDHSYAAIKFEFDLKFTGPFLGKVSFVSPLSKIIESICIKVLKPEVDVYAFNTNKLPSYFDRSTPPIVIWLLLVWQSLRNIEIALTAMVSCLYSSSITETADVEVLLGVVLIWA